MARSPSAKNKLGFNPFQRLDTHVRALQAAKTGGTTVAGLMVFGYVLALVLLTFAGRDIYGAIGPSERMGTYVGDIVAVVLALGLGWLMWKKQPVWAAVVLLVWVVIEALGKFLAIAQGGGGGGGGVFIIVVALIYAILAVRGALALKRLPRDELAVFD